MIRPATSGPSQGLVEAECNILTCSRERIGVFFRKEERRFRKKVPQSAVTKNLLYCQIRFPMRKGSLVTIFSVTEPGLLKAGEELYVCEKFLMGTCQNDSSCLGYHILLPFHWQFHHKYSNCWYSVPLGTQMHLEMIYANPNYTAAKIVYVGKTLYLDMNSKIFQSSSPSGFDYARRICCKSDSPFTPSSEVYWHNGYKWVPYDQESGNQSSNLQNPDGTKTQLEEMYLIKTSRPKYVPLYQNVNKLRIWHSEISKTLSLWGEEATDIYIGEHPYKNQVKMSRRDFFTVVEMAPSEPAYQYCCQLFHDSIPPEQAVVLRIYRLYNPYFWMLYQREKRRLKRLQIPSPLEYHLFCQTPISLEELAKYGLCPKTRGTEGILGRGLYFSLNASVLSSQKTVNSGYMTVLAKVLIGEKTLGNYLFNSAPCKEDGYEYDACVDDMNMPTLFTVFRKELTYPYFIIFYKCIEDPVHLVY
ncbi:protein mono-ADP-ribosyltransferase TIPARP-like [Antechinus flavipes]|uniref:protein mono-ADP-ribosyltransferase TIPARP-like n=1 Tax=Antechinus flavipes TaxID=38775 RepID=UPI002235914B|nr:protein mono-ADP-ribosyltransferase TIPARP-like [Antechinus flavipes]